MTAALTPTLVNRDFQNWLKGALAVLFAKEGLIDLVGHEIIDFQNHLLQTLYTQKGIPPGTTCSSCTTANVLACPTAGFCSKGKKCKSHDSKVPDKKPNQACPNGVCSHIRDTIRNEHRFKGPSWRNTDARKWCSDAFILSKCFMPPDGYSDKTCLEDTDFNGILAVVINNNRFQRKMSVNLGLEPNICTEARIIGRKIRHSANHLLSDQDLKKYIDDLITLLSDSAYLATDVKANDAVSKLKQLKTNTLTIHADDITNMLNESIKTTFDDQQKVLLRDIQEHFKLHKKDSVEAIDRKVQESVDKLLAELKCQTERGKYELNAETEKRKIELNLQSKTDKHELHRYLEHGTHVLNAYTKKGKDELQTQLQQGTCVLGDSIVLYTRTINDIKHKGIEELQEVTKSGKQELEVQSKLASLKINRSADCATTKKTQYGFFDKITFKELRLRSEFKQELVYLYNEKESMIPASPLVEDYAVPLTELYVQPPMSAFNKPNTFGQRNKHSEKTPVRSYRELFLNNDNIPYKNIYVEANAGYGKTSFTQKVAMTWCQAQKAFKLLNRQFKQDDVYTLKRFEFLFLLHLRDYQGDTCNLDKLIFKFVSKNLPNKEQFSKEFITKILQTKTCLVIIDGLDEWVHPETCTLTPGIPHNNYRGNCTVLTTTRPWKLSTIGLPPNLIDRHLEISHLDDTTSNELKSNAVKLLIENSGEKERDLADFDRKASLVKLGDIRLIPYILLQLICIWFDGLSIGKSKCESYSNTIELTLQRGLNKKNASTLPTGNAERNFTVPECMRHNALCNQYMNLLLKLGKLAFYALFQKIKESSLVIDSTTVMEYLTKQELEFCLKIGLLNQSKDRSKVSVKRYQVFFQHKSIQEFMAALYIVSEWNNGTIKSTILEVCSSLSSIIEMENLFVFVCGMNPEIYTCISGELQTIVKRNRITDKYHTQMFRDKIGTMLAYQSMQVQCFQESVRNGNTCSIPLPDIVIRHKVLTEDDVTALVKIINCTIVQTSSGDKTIGLQSLDLYNVAMTHSNLERVYAVISQTTTLTQLKLADIRCSDHTYRDCDVTLDLHRLNELKMLHLDVQCRKLEVNPTCLTLSLGYRSLSDISITALTGLTCLQSLHLADVQLTHSNLICLNANISQIKTLTQLNIYCSDQWFSDCDVTLDLHRLNELKMLHLFFVPCRELHVNPACLEKLEFRPPLFAEKMTARASATLWQDLRAAPVLSSLTLCGMPSCQEMIQTIPTLIRLQHLKIERIDMGDVIPRVSPDMTQLERVVLSSVKMSSAAWRQLLLSVGQLQHPVTVELSSCYGPSKEEWLTIVNVIKTTPTLSLLQDLMHGFGRASLTLKKQ